MLNILKDGFGWVTLIYNDGTSKIIRTTLNAEILADEGITVSNSSLYDFEKEQHISLPEDVKLQISKDRPSLTEVDEFANRFI